MENETAGTEAVVTDAVEAADVETAEPTMEDRLAIWREVSERPHVSDCEDAAL